MLGASLAHARALLGSLAGERYLQFCHDGYRLLVGFTFRDATLDDLGDDIGQSLYGYLCVVHSYLVRWATIWISGLILIHHPERFLGDGVVVAQRVAILVRHTNLVGVFVVLCESN